RLAVVSAAFLVSLSAAAESRRGGMAFHYATPLSARELEWFARFEVLVTHDPLPRAQVDALHRRGTKLVLYEWAVAYYASLATAGHRALPVLNRAPLRGHLGASDADAFYYDPAAREHQRGRVQLLARRLKSIGYDGVFLDTTTAESVHPEALAEYRRRHPDFEYDEAYAGFLENLRDAGVMIVTNQGYRRADQVLPYVAWDVSESLISYPRSGKFVLRPWNDSGDQWNSTAYLFRKLITPAQRKYPKVRFTHINYVTDLSLIDEIVAIARLYDHDAFVARPDLMAPIETELYFLDLGRPKPRVETARGAYRFFERGFVARNAGTKAMKVGKRVVPPGAAIVETTP
ncbi:MAG TPA: hypothetical protein VEU30_17315, partial [Thermoanaerobaculia bacterium]|nr:hypothetical protein [Thermoanaerobaculia bacterium]